MNKKLFVKIVCGLLLIPMLTGCFGRKNKTVDMETKTLDIVQATEATRAVSETKETNATYITEAVEKEEKSTTSVVENKEDPELSNGVEEWEEDDDTKAIAPSTATTPTPPTTKPQETKPQATKPQETKPQETTPPETVPVKPDGTKVSFEQYNNMSSADQQAFFESFENVDAYLAWYDAALKEYENSKNVIEIAGGSVDLGELMQKEG